MKAKDYLERYKAGKTDQDKDRILAGIVNDFVKEVNSIAESRRVKTRGGLLAIYLELDLKWKAFASLVNDHEGRETIKKNGFADFFRNRLPAPFEFMHQHRRLVTR